MSYKLAITIILAITIFGLLYYSYEMLNRPHTDIIQTQKEKDPTKKKLNLIVIIPSPDIKNKTDKLVNDFGYKNPNFGELNMFDDVLGGYTSKLKSDSLYTQKDLDYFKPKKENKLSEGSFIKQPDLFFDTKNEIGLGISTDKKLTVNKSNKESIYAESISSTNNASTSINNISSDNIRRKRLINEKIPNSYKNYLSYLYDIDKSKYNDNLIDLISLSRHINFIIHNLLPKYLEDIFNVFDNYTCDFCDIKEDTKFVFEHLIYKHYFRCQTNIQEIFDNIKNKEFNDKDKIKETLLNFLRSLNSFKSKYNIIDNVNDLEKRMNELDLHIDILNNYNHDKKLLEFVIVNTFELIDVIRTNNIKKGLGLGIILEYLGQGIIIKDEKLIFNYNKIATNYYLDKKKIKCQFLKKLYEIISSFNNKFQVRIYRIYFESQKNYFIDKSKLTIDMLYDELNTFIASLTHEEFFSKNIHLLTSLIDNLEEFRNVLEKTFSIKKRIKKACF